MPAFQLSRKAVEDLKDIGRHTTKQWGREQRNRYLGQLDSQFQALAADPDRGRECSHIREGYRRYPSGRHVIYYRQLSADRIEIVRVLHDRMEPERHL